MSADVPSRSARTARRVLVVALVVAVLLSGCSALSGSDASLPNGTAAADAYRTLDGYTATVDVERSGRADWQAQIWVDPHDGNSRAELLSPPSRAGNVYVANDSTIVQYNATRNEYIQISASGMDRFARGADRVEGAIEDARAEGKTTADGPPVGAGPLPVVPDSGGTTDGADQDQRQFVVSYEGTEQVAGRTAHVIDYTAAGNRTQGILNQTIWLDTEHFVTLKVRQESCFGQNRSTYAFELSNVSFQTDFASGRFTFDPPAGATVNRSQSYDLTSYDSRSDLAAATDVTVPDPAVPDRYSLARADDVDGVAFDAIQLHYRSTTAQLVLTKTTEQSYADTSKGEPVAIGDQTGRYRSTGVRSVVVWECGEYLYELAGDLPKRTMVDVARSVACG